MTGLPRAPDSSVGAIPSGNVWNRLLDELNRFKREIKADLRGRDRYRNTVIWVRNNTSVDWEVGTPIKIDDANPPLPDVYLPKFDPDNPQPNTYYSGDTFYAMFNNVFDGVRAYDEAPDFTKTYGLTSEGIPANTVGRVIINGVGYASVLIWDPPVYQADRLYAGFVSGSQQLNSVSYPTPFRILATGSVNQDGQFGYPCKISVEPVTPEMIFYGKITDVTNDPFFEVQVEPTDWGRVQETREIKLSPALENANLKPNLNDWVTIWTTTEDDTEEEYIIDIAAGSSPLKVTPDTDMNPGVTTTCTVVGGSRAGDKIDVLFDWIDDEKISQGKEVIIARFQEDETTADQIWRPIAAQCEDPPPPNSGQIYTDNEADATTGVWGPIPGALVDYEFGEGFVASTANFGFQVTDPGYWEMSFRFTFEGASPNMTVDIRANTATGPQASLSFPIRQADATTSGAISTTVPVTQAQINAGTVFLVIERNISASGLWISSELDLKRLGYAVPV